MKWFNYIQNNIPTIEQIQEHYLNLKSLINTISANSKMGNFVGGSGSNNFTIVKYPSVPKSKPYVNTVGLKPHGGLELLNYTQPEIMDINAGSKRKAEQTFEFGIKKRRNLKNTRAPKPGKINTNLPKEVILNEQTKKEKRKGGIKFMEEPPRRNPSRK